MDKDEIAIKDKAKEIAQAEAGPELPEGVVILSTGVRVKLHPVASNLVDDLKLAVEDPPVPMVYIESKGREEENPNDPQYLLDLERANAKRGEAIIEAVYLFGIELVDGLPEDTDWLKRLCLLEKRGHLSLDGFDLDDDFDLEFLYKKYYAVAREDLNLVVMLCRLPVQEVVRASRRFQGNAVGRAD